VSNDEKVTTSHNRFVRSERSGFDRVVAYWRSIDLSALDNPLVYLPLFAAYVIFGIFGALVFFGPLGVVASTSWLYPLLYKKLKHMEKTEVQSRDGWWYPGAETATKDPS